MSFPQSDFLINLSHPINVYLLGFLWADGHVDKKYGIKLEIKTSDFNVIKPLFQYYGFKNFKERYRSNSKNSQTSFYIGNKSLNIYLQELEYREKSYIAPSRVLNIIPKHNHYLWWRGYFDGDGCFYTKGSNHSFTVWSSINQDWIELYNLFNTLNISSYHTSTYIRKNGTHCSSCVKISKQDDILKLGTYIYKDNLNIGLTRKYNKYLECITPPSPLFAKQVSNKPGIHFSIWTGKWICRKTINHKRIIIGSFSNYNDACIAYDNYSI